ncbi:MAG: flagellin [Chloroflexi bacterium]|nr:flagellin [Chloroflexota bacterium]
MIINDNLMSLFAAQNLQNTQNDLQKVLQQLSSGLRINSAADDAAGLAIAQKMEAQINGYDQAKRNAQDGISLIQTASGALQEVTSILQRLNELAVEASNGTLQSGDRQQIQQEVNQLFQEIDHIAQSTTFNGVNLLNSPTSTVTFAIGPTASGPDMLTASLADVSNSSSVFNWTELGTAVTTVTVGTSTLSAIDMTMLDSTTTAASVVDFINTAIQKVSAYQAQFGAIQNRLQHTIANLSTAYQNLTSAKAQIMDVDMASAMAQFTRDQILQQAGVAALAQANQVPAAVLKLLG